MSKPKVITLSPVANDVDAVSVAETLAAARLSLLINGANATGYDRNGIATSQTPTSAAAMTLDGAGGTDYNDVGGVLINIYAAANDTGRSFTVVGTNADGKPISEAITGPGSGLITIGTTRFFSITSVTPDAATAGAIEIGSSGIVTFTTPQHITITSAADDSGDTFTVTGEDRYGNAMTEAITGGDTTTALGTSNFAKVYSVVSNGASSGNVSVGVNGLSEGPWMLLNYRGADFNVGIGCSISSGGGMTYAIQHTFTNVLAGGFVEDDAVALTHSTLTGETTNQDGNYTNPPVAMRPQITAFTSGSLTTNVIHRGRS